MDGHIVVPCMQMQVGLESNRKHLLDFNITQHPLDTKLDGKNTKQIQLRKFRGRAPSTDQGRKAGLSERGSGEGLSGCGGEGA